VLPILVFVPMSFTAFKLLFGHFEKAGLFQLQDHCPTPFEGKQPYQRPYLGGYVPAIEELLCVLVSFFHPVFKPEAANHTPFVRDFLASLSACVVIPILEASRSNRPWLLAFPVFIGVIYQLFTIAVTLSAYWAVFLAITRDHATGSQIVQADAEAVLFGLVMGFFIPSFAMAYIATPQPIALWQAFPVLVSLFGGLHHLFRPRSLHGSSGYRTVQATYILTFIVSAVVHLRTLADYNFDPQTIITALIPSLAIPDAKKGHTSLTSIIHLLQWDAAFAFGSTFVASLWFVGSVMQGILLISWIVISTVVLGPGAAISGIFLWREARLNQSRQSLKTKSQ
jgi:hypothetical protein